MEQHPIPQQISSYEFHLVGDMTLKQFVKLAIGLIFAFLIFKSGLPVYFRLPLSFFFGLLGVASAFLPIHDRPFEVWVINFFKRAYSPTIFLWKKQEKDYAFATVTASPPVPKAKTVHVEDKYSKLDEYAGTLPQDYSPDLPPEIEPETKPESKPILTSLQPQRLGVKKALKSDGSTGPDFNFDKAEQISPETMGKIEDVLRGPKPAGNFSQPEYEQTPMPATPTVPNIVNGIILNEKGSVIEGAIVEIQDIGGNPIRAMRTNSLGQFQTATPLSEGDYLIIAEKEPYRFDIIKLKIEGVIVRPIKIQARKGAVA
jgi:hypothetical protein